MAVASPAGSHWGGPRGKHPEGGGYVHYAYVLLALSFSLFNATLVAVQAADRAVEVMHEVDRRQRSESRSYHGAIEVIDNKGKALHKSWQFWAEGHRGTSKVLVRFTAPAEVRGVGFLTLNHPSRPAEQWLYTPSVQRERRITLQEKSARFVGTDFTYEDMEERSVEDYHYELVGEEPFEGQPAYKIKAVHKDREHTQYSQQLLWVRKDIMAVAFMELYIEAKLRRTLRWDDWQPVQGIWTAHSVGMKDLTRGSTTWIRVSNVRYNLTFEPDWFDLRNLRRVF